MFLILGFYGLFIWKGPIIVISNFFQLNFFQILNFFLYAWFLSKAVAMRFV